MKPDTRPMMRPWQPAALLLLACIFVTACSTRISVPERTGMGAGIPADWNQREQALLALDRWQLIGKIAVRQPGQAESAVINRWEQDGDAYSLRLSSAFLGLGNVQLDGDGEFLLIRTGNGERYRSDDPEALVQEVTGWRLPLSDLPYWVRGIPAPGSKAELGFGDSNQLKTLLQSGWEVHFQRYADALDGRPPLPSLITATNGEARVRLAISEWQVGAQEQ